MVRREIEDPGTEVRTFETERVRPEIRVVRRGSLNYHLDKRGKTADGFLIGFEPNTIISAIS